MAAATRTKARTTAQALTSELIWCGGILYQRGTLYQELLDEGQSARAADYFAFRGEALDLTGDSITLPAVGLVCVAPGRRQRMTANEIVAWIEHHMA